MGTVCCVGIVHEYEHNPRNGHHDEHFDSFTDLQRVARDDVFGPVKLRQKQRRFSEVR